MPADVREVETELPDSQPQRRSGPWPLIVVVVVLTLIAVWLVPGEEEDPAVAPGAAAPSLLQEPATVAPTVEPGTADTLPGPAAPVDDRPGARARALIAEMRASGSLSLDEVFAAGVAAQEAGELPDAYLLYFFAAREGHTEAALTLARQADPATRATDSVYETPDLVQAHKWYELAARQGSETAQAGLADLRARVDRRAAEGDPEAQRIVLLWQ